MNEDFISLQVYVAVEKHRIAKVFILCHSAFWGINVIITNEFIWLYSDIDDIIELDYKLDFMQGDNTNDRADVNSPGDDTSKSGT